MNMISTPVRDSIVSGVATNRTPSQFSLDQNYPNPFNPTTNFSFRIAESGLISLKIYDILGNEVATLVNGYKSPGHYDVPFDASHLASGVYYYELRAEKFRGVKRMVVLK